MKRLLLFLFLVLPMLCFGATLPIYFNATNGTAFGVVSGVFTNHTTNFVFLAPWGNDTNGNGTVQNPYKTPWDIYNDSGDFVGGPAIVAGAITKAKPGQTLVAMPGTHYWAACPLSATNRLNLWIQDGAIVLRGNFSNSTTANLSADLNTCGPLIQPSDGSIIVNDGAVIATNSPGSFNACLGWFEGLATRNSFGTDYGFENRSATNVTISGNGKWIGPSDVVYMVQTNTALRSMVVKDGIYRSGWDCFRVNGNVVLDTMGLDVFSTNSDSSPTFFFSRGVVVSSGTIWTDIGSKIGSGGGTNHFGNYPVLADGATTIAQLSGTYLFNTTNTGGLISNANSAILRGNYTASNKVVALPNTVYHGNGAGLTNLGISVATNLTDWNRLVVTNDTGTGNVLITNGAIAASASIDSTGGSVRAGTAGGAATPSLGWNSSASGFYLPAAASVHVTANGANMASFNAAAPSLVVSNGLTILLGTLSGVDATLSSTFQALAIRTVTNAVGDIARPNMAIGSTYFSTNNNVVFVGLQNVPGANPGVEAYTKIVITNTAANKTVAFPAMWNISGGASQTLSNIGTLKIWALAGVYTNAEWGNHK